MDVNKLCFGCMKEKEDPGQQDKVPGTRIR